MDTNCFEPTVFKLPLPSDFKDERDEDVLARANSLCGAAEQIYAAMQQSGQTPVISEAARFASLDAFGSAKKTAAVQQTAVALHLTALLQEYDMPVVQNAQQVRNLCMNRLIEHATSAAKVSDQLRAIEMLGKVKDVGLFEERTTVLVEHMSSDDIKKALAQKINNMRYSLNQAQPVTDVEATEVK